MKKAVFALLSLIISTSAFAQSEEAFERRIKARLKEDERARSTAGIQFTTVVSHIESSEDLDVLVKQTIGKATTELCRFTAHPSLLNSPVQNACGEQYALTLKLWKDAKGNTFLYQGIGWKGTTNVFFFKNTYVSPVSNNGVTASTDPDATAYRRSHCVVNGVDMCK